MLPLAFAFTVHCFRDPTSFDQGLELKVFHYSLLLAETVFLHSHVRVNDILLSFFFWS